MELLKTNIMSTSGFLDKLCLTDIEDDSKNDEDCTQDRIVFMMMRIGFIVVWISYQFGQLDTYNMNEQGLANLRYFTFLLSFHIRLKSPNMY